MARILRRSLDNSNRMWFHKKSWRLIIRRPRRAPRRRRRIRRRLALRPEPPPAPELPRRGRRGLVPRGRRRPRLHPVGGQPARDGARGVARRPAVRPVARPPDGRAHRGRPRCCSPRRVDHGPAPGGPRRPLAYAAGETGTLRVGVYQSVGTRILPAIIGRFAEAWPGVEVQLREAASDEGLLDLVEPGQLDMTFGVLPTARRAVRRRRAGPGTRSSPWCRRLAARGHGGLPADRR